MKREKINAEDLFSALKEKKITARELAEDLKIILDDFFVGSPKADDNKIQVTFFNGQEFEICVSEKISRLHSK